MLPVTMFTNISDKVFFLFLKIVNMSLILQATYVTNLAIKGLIPDHDFDKGFFKEELAHAVCTQQTPDFDFRLAMGAKEESVNDKHWLKDATVFTEGIFTGLDVRFYSETAEINFIECRKQGYFFLFFEVLKNVCRHHGIKEIVLCNRADNGFWEYHGFAGPDYHMTHVVGL